MEGCCLSLGSYNKMLYTWQLKKRLLFLTVLELGTCDQCDDSVSVGEHPLPVLPLSPHMAFPWCLNVCTNTHTHIVHNFKIHSINMFPHGHSHGSSLVSPSLKHQ